MTPLPGALGGSALIAWRLDPANFAASWDSGEGAYRFGGRWNSAGVRAVYASLDPAAAILEVAVHKGFETLDIVAHTLTAFEILDPAAVHIINRDAISNPNWLTPGVPSAGQQAFGDALLATHTVVIIPSTVSPYSWNLVFTAARADNTPVVRSQERFALDTRLNLALTARAIAGRITAIGAGVTR